MAKKLTVRQKQKAYRTAQYGCVVGEFLSVFTPFIIMGAVNADTWFKSESGWKIGLGGALALALLGIATFLVAKKKEDESKVTNGWVMFLVGWAAVTFIFILLQNIMDQIATIMLYGLIGLGGACGLDFTSKHFQRKADLYKDAIGEVTTDKLKEQIQKEVEEEKIKVKAKVVNK